MKHEQRQQHRVRVAVLRVASKEGLVGANRQRSHLEATTWFSE